MNGKSTFFRIEAYDTAYFNCFLLISFFLLRTFNAYRFPLLRYLARYTCPKDPFPRSFINLKSLNEILV